jgi:hypothetical protein
MMLKLELRYVAHISMLTGNILKETWQANATTIRELIGELDVHYGGFNKMFIDQGTDKLCLNATIYYNMEGQAPSSILDLDYKLSNNAIVTFW